MRTRVATQSQHTYAYACAFTPTSTPPYSSTHAHTPSLPPRISKTDDSAFDWEKRVALVFFCTEVMIYMRHLAGAAFVPESPTDEYVFFMHGLPTEVCACVVVKLCGVQLCVWLCVRITCIYVLVHLVLQARV